MALNSITGHITGGIKKLAKAPGKMVKKLTSVPQAVTKTTESIGRTTRDIVSLSSGSQVPAPKRFTKMKSSAKPPVVISLKPKPLSEEAIRKQSDKLKLEELRKARLRYQANGLDPSLVTARRDANGRLSIVHDPPPKLLAERFREATKESEPTRRYLQGYKKATTETVTAPFKAAAQLVKAGKNLATNPEAQRRLAEAALLFSRDSEQIVADLARAQVGQLRQDVKDAVNGDQEKAAGLVLSTLGAGAGAARAVPGGLTKTAAGVSSSLNATRKGLCSIGHGDLRAVENAPAELLEQMAKPRHGRDIVVAAPGSDDYRFLQYMDAEGMAVGADKKTILLRGPDPKKAVAWEEFLHGTQAKLGIIRKDLGVGSAGATAEEIRKVEYHVKDFMIRHRKLLGLGDEDVQILERLRQHYE